MQLKWLQQNKIALIDENVADRELPACSSGAGSTISSSTEPQGKCRSTKEPSPCQGQPLSDEGYGVHEAGAVAPAACLQFGVLMEWSAGRQNHRSTTPIVTH
jgi:hypothetical protein